MNQSIIKKNVMRRVHFLHTARKFTQPRVLKLGLLFVFVALQSFFVSIPNVISNFGTSLRSAESLYSFVVTAFANTQFAVQAISLGIAVVAVLFVRDLVRATAPRFASQMGVGR